MESQSGSPEEAEGRRWRFDSENLSKENCLEAWKKILSLTALVILIWTSGMNAIKIEIQHIEPVTSSGGFAVAIFLEITQREFIKKKLSPRFFRIYQSE